MYVLSCHIHFSFFEYHHVLHGSAADATAGFTLGMQTKAQLELLKLHGGKRLATDEPNSSAADDGGKTT